ncbi:MAG: hypothetical protein KU28_06270 [Sulfurovum sp. PC08-66]|jgi:hypothetical protein|nr:MAG: hypothetical protein KU28_06270 [Sulfurovum sp. PC08-66]
MKRLLPFILLATLSTLYAENNATDTTKPNTEMEKIDSIEKDILDSLEADTQNDEKNGDKSTSKDKESK